MSAKTMKANKASSTEIKNALKKYPGAFITDIAVHNKDFYTLVGANVIKGKGIDTSLSAKVFTVDISEWKGKTDKEKTAEYFGFEVLMILHDPTLKVKEEVKAPDNKGA